MHSDHRRARVSRHPLSSGPAFNRSQGLKPVRHVWIPLVSQRCVVAAKKQYTKAGATRKYLSRKEFAYLYSASGSSAMRRRSLRCGTSRRGRASIAFKAAPPWGAIAHASQRVGSRAPSRAPPDRGRPQGLRRVHAADSDVGRTEHRIRSDRNLAAVAGEQVEVGVGRKRALGQDEVHGVSVDR